MKKDGTAAYGTVFHVVFVGADDINLNVNLFSTIRAANLHWIEVAHYKSSEPGLLQERSATEDKRQHKQHEEMKKSILAMSVAAAAIPPNPKTAAMIAITRNITAHLSIVFSFSSHHPS